MLEDTDPRLMKYVDPEKSNKENAIQMDINRLVDQKKSLVFNAGAGSGKTYALVETIKYLLIKEIDRLEMHNQKIVVITYTNVAAEEIKTRIGNSQFVLVSTIHERIWDLIRVHQRELIDIHLENLKFELKKTEETIKQEERFMQLDKTKQENFTKVMMKNKEVFYKYYEVGAREAKSEYSKIQFSFDLGETKLLNSVSRFRKLVGNLIRKEKYQYAINQILKREIGYKEVKYNTRISRDRLDKMEIGHDTVLNYGKSIIQKYELLQKIIINKYPYFFIDEYQDTNPLVVDMMQTLDNYSNETQHAFFVGYFGDELQSIYSDGVGDILIERHMNLEIIFKPYNRRSFWEVIEVINEIRDDELKQESIYKDCTGGSVKFYYGNEKEVGNFISYYKRKWNINGENPLDCLVLTNNSVANYTGFSRLFAAIKDSNRYREGIGFTRLNEELLSKEFDKLGEVQKTLYNLFELLSIIVSKEKTVNNILVSEAIRKKLSLAELNIIIKSIESIRGDTLGEILESVEKSYKSNDTKKFKILINHKLTLNEKIDFTVEGYKEFLEKYLGGFSSDENMTEEKQNERSDRAKNTVNELLSIKAEELFIWYKFLAEKNESSVRYHTYHGTKGLEFSNVIIIMENKFGWRSLFDKYFHSRSNVEILKEKDLSNFNEARNLLYVAASRAIKNLRIFYIDDISDFREGIKNVFGEPQLFFSESPVED